MQKWIIALTLAVILAVSAIWYLTIQNPNASDESYQPYENPHVYIRSDGNVEPSTAPIKRIGNLYTLEDEIEVEKLSIEKNNITLDGNGFSFTSVIVLRSKGGPVYGSSSVEILNAKNVILRDLESKYGASLTFSNSSSCHVVNSNITVNINNSHNITVVDMERCSVHMENSTNCTISLSSLSTITLKNSDENMILNNDMTHTLILAFRLENSESNLFFGNSVERAHKLFEITGSSGNNLFVGNYIRGAFSIDPILDCSGTNTFYHNNFFYVYWNKTLTSTANMWDNGFEGNYWNDYQGEDSNSDGLGDVPHLIDTNNQDRHPLIDQVDLSLEPQPQLPQ
jgi:parallel beta-helix repeat protein